MSENYHNIIKKISQALENRQKVSQGQQIFALFDADGTLWNTDVGEDFLAFMADKNMYNHENPMQHYMELRWKVNKEQALAWQVSGLQGHKLVKVQEYAQQWATDYVNFPVYKQMLAMISTLQDLGVKIVVVSASPLWAVDAICKKFGIPIDNIIAVEPELQGGKIAAVTKLPITSGSGKKIAFEREFGKVDVVMAAGNTFSDLQMIELARVIKLCVYGAKQNQAVYASEQEFVAFARQQNWYVLRPDL